MNSNDFEVKVKICGITNIKDAAAAIEAGANYIGLIFAPSKRRLIKSQAKLITDAFPAFNGWVAVFMNGKKKDIDANISGLPIQNLQFHGEETPAFCNYFSNRNYRVIKAIPMNYNHPLLDPAKYSKTPYFLLDSVVAGQSGGTGVPLDWQQLRNTQIDIRRSMFLSGGLTPENVKEAIEILRPFAVDVSSGVELEPGIKNHKLIVSFFAQVRKGIDYVKAKNT